MSQGNRIALPAPESTVKQALDYERALHLQALKGQGARDLPEAVAAVDAALAVLVADRDEARASEAEVRRQHAVVMERIKTGGGLPDGETEWRDGEYRAWQLWLGQMVECPGCAFTFGADHTDTPSGGYSCPNCSAEGELAGCREALREIEYATQYDGRRWPTQCASLVHRLARAALGNT